MGDGRDTEKAEILTRARALGFDVAAVTAPDSIPHVSAQLQTFLSKGYHGSMGWLETRADERAEPKVLWPEVRSIVMVGMNYGPARDPMALLPHRERGVISVYAQGADYHDVLKKRLKQLGRWLAETRQCGVKVFVDTAPVAEKPLAEAAGLGWQGKHTNLVSREAGSWLFLGALYTTLALEPDAAQTDHCGSCRACLDICPTKAFPAPYELDARRCISYLTIEHKGPIPRDLRPAMGNRIYGCDDCLAVCPWNKFAARTREIAFHPRAELTAPRLADLAGLDDGDFRSVFSRSPIKRIGRDRFVRNVLIALGNSGRPDLAPAASRLLADQSALVRGAAVWALSRLLPDHEFDALKARHAGQETDLDVRTEWGACADPLSAPV